MKILILNWRDITNPFSGGAEISLFEHAKYWQKKGAEVLWISSAFPDAKRKETIEGIKITRLGSVYTVHVITFFYLLRNFTEFDIIIDSFHFIPFFSIFYRLSNTKIIGLINEVAGKVWFYNIFFPLSFLGYIIEPWIIKLYKKKTFITASASTKDELSKIGIPSENIHVVPHGISLSLPPKNIQKGKNPILVFLARISKDKGIKEAIEVFKQIVRKHKDTKFWIIGKEEEKGLLASLLRDEEKKVKENITYFGYVSEKEKFILLKKAWILIHPSYKEGWGLNVIEANSVGTPAVGYNVAGLQDSIQDKKTGLLTKKNTIKDLTKLVELLLENKTLYKKLSNNAIIWSKTFSWEKSGQASWHVIRSEYEKSK